MFFHDFPVFRWKSGCRSISPPKFCAGRAVALDPTGKAGAPSSHPLPALGAHHAPRTSPISLSTFLSSFCFSSSPRLSSTCPVPSLFCTLFGARTFICWVLIPAALHVHGTTDARRKVASQFNCLEFPSPSAQPEDGVSVPRASGACLVSRCSRVFEGFVWFRITSPEDHQFDLMRSIVLRLGAGFKHLLMSPSRARAEHVVSEGVPGCLKD